MGGHWGEVKRDWVIREIWESYNLSSCLPWQRPLEHQGLLRIQGRGSYNEKHMGFAAACSQNLLKCHRWFGPWTIRQRSNLTEASRDLLARLFLFLPSIAQVSITHGGPI